jgi:pimeloyl-ACP methyl ester carboxylesterase
MSEVREGSVESLDGTSIGYRAVGRGPGIVLLHGAMSSGYHHIELARLLGDAFTVYLPDRRGRGLSGPYGQAHSVEREVEDIAAVVCQTGAQNLCGISVGAIIALEAARQLPSVRKLAVYEPPLFVDRPAPTAWLARFEAEIAEGHVAAALVTGMKASQLGPPFLNLMPRWLLERMTRKMMAFEGRAQASDYVPMGVLAPTLREDGLLIAGCSAAFERFRNVTCDVLLLGGTKSPRYMNEALDMLEHLLPHMQRVEFRGLNHGASWNADRRGQPGPVAAALRRFFADGGGINSVA